MTEFLPVTDHAVLRYLERVLEMDVQAVRALIHRETEYALKAGSTKLKRDGVHYVMSGGKVVTVFIRSGRQEALNA